MPPSATDQSAETPLPDAEPDLTFRSIFASPETSSNLKVPDYQRAFSWQEKQVSLFVSDLIDYQASGRPYYFGPAAAHSLLNRFHTVSYDNEALGTISARIPDCSDQQIDEAISIALEKIKPSRDRTRLNRLVVGMLSSHCGDPVAR